MSFLRKHKEYMTISDMKINNTSENICKEDT